jgi:MYXO-CTERM domain-containing protein
LTGAPAAGDAANGAESASAAAGGSPTSRQYAQASDSSNDAANAPARVSPERPAYASGDDVGARGRDWGWLGLLGLFGLLGLLRRRYDADREVADVRTGALTTRHERYDTPATHSARS